MQYGLFFLTGIDENGNIKIVCTLGIGRFRQQVDQFGRNKAAEEDLRPVQWPIGDERFHLFSCRSLLRQCWWHDRQCVPNDGILKAY